MMASLIGTAGWTIPRQHASAFDGEGSSLERYASSFSCAEINSSFHRPHRTSTWARWSESTPPDFLFSAKVPKAITHQRKLVGCEDEVAAFIAEAGALGPKLAVLLVQLPPSLAFDPSVAGAFFAMLGSMTGAQVVCEPRHASWFEEAADELLCANKVARVAADPACAPAAALPGGWQGLSYWRLHGSPAVYRSAYGTDRLRHYAALLGREVAVDRQVWCIFDNTAASAAIGDALELMHLVNT
jgi:uncharacterized protein YecE (DUF72 family)